MTASQPYETEGSLIASFQIAGLEVLVDHGVTTTLRIRFYSDVLRTEMMPDKYNFPDSAPKVVRNFFLNHCSPRLVVYTHLSVFPSWSKPC